MGLRTVVKVGGISNLSDARYCAGMGVYMLGFRVIEGQQKYVSPHQFQELRGWFSGPKVVAELFGISSHAQLNRVIKEYQPDLIELSMAEFLAFPTIDQPVIISLTDAEYGQYKDRLLGIGHQLRYIIVSSSTNSHIIRDAGSHFQVLLSDIHGHVEEMLALPIAGFALRGSPEERPGYKTYAELSDVLSLLEQDQA